MDPQLYRDFARLEDRHWWFQGRRAIVRSLLRSRLPPRPLQVLDVGCGTGGMLKMLEEFGRVEGLDTSAEGLAYCRERVGPGVELHRGALPAGIPAGRRYDLITAFDVLEHIPDAVGAVAALRRALGAQGTFVCTVPAYQFLWSEHDVVNHHQRRYTRVLLTEQLGEAGFEVVYSSYFNAGLFAPIALVRLGQRLLASAAAPAARSDFEELPGLVNWTLATLFSAERWVVPRVALPFGVSILAVARPR